MNEVTAEDLLRANQYWDEQKTRTRKIAEELGYNPEEITDDLLFDIFDGGDLNLTDEELRGEVEEYFN